MCNNNQYIRFDWAAKRILRDKANFGVLEGLVTVLLNEEIRIIEILESEGNQETADDKFNRVDIKARNSKDEIIIVEIQLTRELYYLERILYGVAKAITEHISLGDKYDKVKKIYSINILYFDLGKGADYLYHGQTVFRGVHTNDTLVINTKESDVIRMRHHRAGRMARLPQERTYQGRHNGSGAQRGKAEVAVHGHDKAGKAGIRQAHRCHNDTE